MNLFIRYFRYHDLPGNLMLQRNRGAESSGERTRPCVRAAAPRCRERLAWRSCFGEGAETRTRGACAPRTPQRVRDAAYSLIEVLIASGILLTGIAAVAMMAHTMFLQEEGNGRVTRAINLQEQAATLWQLGLSPDTITNILPERCVASNSLAADTVCLTFSNNADITNLGINAAQSVNLTIVFHSATAANGTLIYQTNTNVTVVRPSTR